MNKVQSHQQPLQQSRFNRISSLHINQNHHSNAILPSLYSQNKKNDAQHSQQITDLKRSHSVSTIIHGSLLPGSVLQPQPPKPSHHYIDSLQRFHRDHASKDKEQRDLKRIFKEKTLQKRRQLKINRQSEYRQRQDHNYQRTIQQNERALEVYKTGMLKNTHYNSIPVNPINLKYDNSEKGRYQQYIDDDKKIKGLVRTHHLQTIGTSGYNIINGVTHNYTDKLLPKGQQNQIKFEQNLAKFYSNFSIKPIKQ